MAMSRTLRRLLRIVDIQENQSRIALESAVGELKRLERLLAAAEVRARGGRKLVLSSAQSGELPDRLAGLEETRAAARRAEVLGPRIANAELEVASLREAFLAKRVERRQVETLIRETEAKDAVVADRRSQRSLDDWYLNRMQAAKRAVKPEKSTASSVVPVNIPAIDRQPADET